jgi:uncharacterized protein YceK
MDGNRTGRARVAGVEVIPMRLVILLLAAVATLSGCASMGSSRQTVDIEAYSMCLRTGGQWWPDEQFGGNCIYQAPDFR